MVKFPIFLIILLITLSCSSQKEVVSKKNNLKTDFASCSRSGEATKFKILTKNGKVYNVEIDTKERLLERIEQAKYCTEDKQCISTDLPQQFGGCTVGLNISLSRSLATETRNYAKLFCSEKINSNCEPPTVLQCIKNRCVSNGDL